MNIPLLKIKKLSILKKNEVLLNGVDFFLHEKETVGLFGRSGSGKSVFSLFINGLLNFNVFSISSEEAVFLTKKASFNLLNNSNSDWNFFRSRFVSMVFQDPSSSLNPTLTCGFQLSEGFSFLCKKKSIDLKKKCISLLKEVGIENPEKTFNSFPHELSGGQKQRVVIAIALSKKLTLLKKQVELIELLAWFSKAMVPLYQ